MFSSTETGDGTISYSQNGKTYVMNTVAFLPRFGLYTDTTASDSTYVWGLYNYEDTKVFNIISAISDISDFEVLSIGYKSGQSFIKVPFTFNSENKTVSWSHRMASLYKINIRYKTGEITVEDSFEVRNQSDLAGIMYDDDYINFGLSRADDLNNLHIVNEYQYYTCNQPQTIKYVLAAGILYGPSAMIAENAIYERISDVK